MCVDGQQRLTTTSLLVAAVADLLHDLQQAEAEAVVQQCEHFLFRDREAATTTTSREATTTTEAGQSFSCLRLLPSDVDREPFLRCLLGNRSKSSNNYQEGKY